jgi:predicted DNA-binding antitoxin AbrB/MazE fold protein
LLTNENDKKQQAISFQGAKFMPTTLIATYENGVLRPSTPLSIPERTRVRIQIEQILPDSDAAAHRRQVREALAVAGLSLPVSNVPPSAQPLTVQRQEELAQLFSDGRPLSELILEEREDR